MQSIQLKFGKRKVNAQLLTTVSELTNGLMFKSGTVLMKLPKENRAYAAIHTFFCKPMTIAWLDPSLRILELVHAKPFRFYVPKKPAAYIFESTDLSLKPKNKITFIKTNFVKNSCKKK